DSFPGIFTNDSYTSTHSPGASGNTNGDRKSVVTGKRASRSSITYTVKGTVSPTASGSLCNSATVNAPPSVAHGKTGNKTATDTDTLAASGDLSITKTDGKSSVTPGTSDTYPIVVSNSGPSTVTGATVDDLFPGIFTNDSFTSTASPGASGNTNGTGDIHDTVTMASGSTITYTVTGTVSPTASGNLVNTPTVSPPSALPDRNPGNNPATDPDTLSASGDLSITKTDNKASVIPGQSDPYTIVVSNSGPSTVTGATVADSFPSIFTGATWTSTHSSGVSDA